MPVTTQHRPPGERHRRVVGHQHEATEPDHTGHGQDDRGGTHELFLVAVQ